MSELIQNLQEIYNQKLAIKAAIGTQSDNLEDYAGYITAMKPNGYTYITENGDHSVSGYAYVNVDVPTGGGSGDIFVSNMSVSDQINLDGMNNIVYINGNVPTYAITTQIFTQEYPTSGYLKPLPSEINISNDANINAYLFEPTAMAQRDFSYASVNDTIEGVDAISEVEDVSTNELFKARVKFKYNTNQLKYQSNTTKCFSTDGINSNIDSTSLIETTPFGVKEYMTTDYYSQPMVFDSGITGRNNFGSYIVIPWLKTNGQTQYVRTQYPFTATGSYLYFTPGMDDEYHPSIMSYVNHKIYDCVLQRTSVKGGFTSNKYDTVLVDLSNYVGEIQQDEILGMKYGSTDFDYDSAEGAYTYMIHLTSNQSIQARTTYFQMTTDGSSWSNFNFCEDMAGTTPGTVGLSLRTTPTTKFSVDCISNYVSIPSRLPSNYFRNTSQNELDVKISVNKDTWKVNYEFIPKEGIYMKLYNSLGKFEYIKCDGDATGGDGDNNWTEYNFVYDKTKGSGYTFVFVKFENNTITGYCTHLYNYNVNIWEYNASAQCPVEWSNTEPTTGRFIYPTQSDVDDDGAIFVTYGDKEVAWMNIGAES